MKIPKIPISGSFFSKSDDIKHTISVKLNLNRVIEKLKKKASK